MADLEPEREQIPDGFIEVASDYEVTPLNDIEDRPEDRIETPELDPEVLPHLRTEQI